MASKQESNHAYYELAKEIAKIERQLQMERWVRVGIEMTVRRTEHGEERVRLHAYDLPVALYLRREWVIRWRAAKLQCEHPRNQVNTYCDYYRRVQGANIGMQKDIDTFITAKAQVTRQQQNIDEYLRRQREDSFFNEGADEGLTKIREKLAQRKQQVAEAEARLIAKVKEYQRQNKLLQQPQQELTTEPVTA